MRRTCLALLAAAVGWAAVGDLPAGDAPAVLTLDDAIAIALAGNPALAAADAGARAAGARIEEASAVRVPEVTLSETISYTTNPVYVFGNLLGQEAFGPENFDPDYLNRPDPLSNWNSMLSVRVPVYVGGRISGGIGAAEAGRDAAEADRQRAREEVVHAVTAAYTGVALADARLEVATQARDVAAENVRLVRDLRETGLVVESDLLQAEVRRSEVEEMVVRAEAGTRIARAGLNAAMGRDLDAPVQVAMPDEPAAPVEEDLDALVAEALERRSDLRAAAARVEVADRIADSERAGRRPEIGVEGRYEANAEEFVGADGTNWSLFASARWTVFDGRATGARVRRARAEAEAAAGARRVLEDRVGLEVRTAYHDVEAARKSLDAARGAVGMAEESLRIVRDRYREGLTTLVELLDAENFLTRARVRRVAARREVHLSRAALDLAVGRSVASPEGAGRSER